MIASRLVAYQPNGARIGVLPDPASWSGHMPVNGVSALTLSYFGGSDGSDALADPVEVALEVSNGGPWAEPANARFLRLVRDRDLVDKSDLWKFSMPGYAHLLKGACVLAAKTPSEANTDKDGKRKFLSANAGTIVKTVLDEARALDPRVLEGLTIDFTTSRDSAGALWSKVITIYYAPGMGLDTIIDNLAAQGVIDWELQGRTLRLLNPDTVLARKLPQVRIHDQDSEQAPIKATLEGLRHLVLLQGDEGKLWTKENVSVPTPWGKSITFITQGGVSDEGTASTLIQAELDAGSRERVQYTRALTLTEHTPTPFVDYRPGDYIQAHDAGDKWASLRVFALGLGRENGVHKVTLTLGDLFEDAQLRQAKRTKGIVGGSSADGGSGARPAPPEPGTRKPMAPAGLVMNSDHYFDARGVAHASVLAAYAPATHGVDGLGLTIQAHELFGRQVGSTSPYRMLTSVEGETDTIGFSPLPVQTHWDFRVRAIAENGVPSEWSNVVRLELARDTTPPPPPSIPKLTTRLGTIRVEWDGLTYLGTPMPVDFDYCEVEITNHGGSGFISAGQLRALTGSDFTVLAGVPYNTATQVRLIAVDSSGNRSAPSPEATISTTPLVNDDLTATTIFDDLADLEAGVTTAQNTANSRNQLFRSTFAPYGSGYAVGDQWWRFSGTQVIGLWVHTGSVWVSQTLTDAVITNLDAGSITAGYLAAERIAARTITALMIAVNGVTADNIMAGAVTTLKMTANAIDATRLDALAITAKHTITGALFQTTATALRGLKFNSSGLFAYNSSGEQTVSIYSGTGNATVTGKVQTGLGSNQVVMSDNIGRGRPGISFDTGSTAALEPRIQSLGVGSDGFPAGALVLTGRETTLNSSGRADLVLEHGGDFQLKQNWGTRSGLGVNSSGDYLNLIGRMSKTSHNRQMLYAGESSSWTNLNPGAYHEWSFTYGTPPAVGTRVPLLVSNTSGAMVTNLADYSASGFTARTHNLQTAGTPGYNVHYVSVNK